MRLDNVSEKKRKTSELVEKFLNIQKEVGVDVVDTKQLIERTQRLKDGKFTVAVCGEVKAGKSTFINALLGEEILPTDVLQCTSTIIEINKSDHKFIRVKYHNNHTEEIGFTSKDKVREFLKGIAQIPDKYRDIPTTLIDDCIVNNRPLPSKDELEKESRIEDLNYPLCREYYEKRIKEPIPVEIVIGYPFRYEVDEVIVADTPGVNAVGGVQNRTYSFLTNADALFFVHPIKPVESESFKNFVKRVISNKSKEFLFLILTHKGQYTDKDSEDLKKEAQRIYKKYIKPERIIPVDSVLRLIWHETQNGVSLSEIIKDEAKRKLIADILNETDNNEEIINKINEASNFDHLEKALDEFLSRRIDIQILGVLDSLKKGYENINGILSNKINFITTKIRCPQDFEKAKENYREQLKKYERLLNEYSEEIKNEYLNVQSSWQNDLEKIRNDINFRINKALSDVSHDKENIEVVTSILRKVTTDISEEIDDIANRVLKEIGDKLNKKMIELGREFKNRYTISVPKVDIEGIREKTISHSYINVPIYKRTLGWWLGLPITAIFAILGNKDAKEELEKGVKVGERQEYSESKHLSNILEEINKQLNEQINNVKSDTKSSITKYISDFNAQLPELRKLCERNIEKLEEEEKTNEELINEKEKLVKKRQEVEEQLNIINNLEQELADA